MFGSCWLGKLKSAWGWILKNEAFEEGVKSFRQTAGESVSGSIGFRSVGDFTWRTKFLCLVAAQWLLGHHPQADQERVTPLQPEVAELAKERAQNFLNLFNRKSNRSLSRARIFHLHASNNSDSSNILNLWSYLFENEFKAALYSLI